MCGQRELDTGGEGGMKGLVGWGDRLEETDNWSWDKELRHVDQHVVRSLRNTNCECQAIITRGE